MSASTLYVMIVCIALFANNGTSWEVKKSLRIGGKYFMTKTKISVSTINLQDASSRKTQLNTAFDCIDEVVIFVRGGSGGPGATTFKFGKGRQHCAPSGGSGGDGGSVIITADLEANTLRAFRHQKSFKAPAGSPGNLEFTNGAKAHDLYVAVPVGTLIYDNTTNVLLGTISDAYSRVIVAKGGQGGKGNAQGLQFSQSQGGKSVGSPPEGGMKRWLRLELQLIADIGLIGLPNAGKSTVLNALTNARPKIADYAFTTLVPNLGVCYVVDETEYCDDIKQQIDAQKYLAMERRMVLADIPGLIENAHKGKGLGKQFLKHVERCQVLLHVVSAASLSLGSAATDQESDFERNVEAVVKDYLTINQELLLSSPQLTNKPQIVVLNKIDSLRGTDMERRQMVNRLCEALKKVMPHSRIVPVAAIQGYDHDDMRLLANRTWQFLQKVVHKELRRNGTLNFV